MDEIISKLLDELAILIEKCNEEYVVLSLKVEEYNYIQDLISILKEHKIGFCREYFNSSEEKKELFKNILNKINDDTFSTDTILSEINKLYYLDKDGIINDPSIDLVVKRGIDVLDDFLKKLEDTLLSINISSLKEELNILKKDIEGMVKLGALFDGNHLDEEISDIDSVVSILEKVNISESSKNEILEYILLTNVGFYKESLLDNIDSYGNVDDQMLYETIELDRILREVREGKEENIYSLK